MDPQLPAYSLHDAFRFHFCPFPDANESIDAALSRHERSFVRVTKASPSAVLDRS